MERIKFTEDREEMIAIAKAIVEEKKAVYTEAMTRIVMASIKSRYPEAGEEELLTQFYLTVYHYWAYGANADEYYYYRFAHKSHEEKMTYMTYRFRMIYGDHINPREKDHFLMNKFETYQYFTEEFRRDMMQCNSEKDLPEFLAFTAKHPEFVVKPTDMGGGRGVHKDSVAGFGESEKKAYFKALLEEGIANRAKYMKGKAQSIVLEEVIDQDEGLAVFNPQSVNGVRLNTLLLNGKVVMYEPWLKIGRGGNFLTSAVFGTMDAGIDEKTGVVNTAGYTETGEIWEKHPDNGIRIPGFQVPRWDELLEFATKCALKMPFLTYIAWDFALSKKGWCIQEGNFCGDFMWQLYRERGMRKEFEDLIGWKCEKEFWWQ